MALLKIKILKRDDLNMDEVSVQTAVQDAESVPFFWDRRLAMIDNPTFLTGEKEKKSIDHQLDRLQGI